MPIRVLENSAVLLEAIIEGVTLQRPDGSLAYANSAAARLIGYPSPEALLEAPAAELLAPFELFNENGRPLDPADLPGRRALRGESPPEILCRFRHRDTGAEQWSIVSARPIFDEAGQLRYALNLFRDVTDRIEVLQAERRAAQEAAAARDRLEFLTRASELLAHSLDFEATLNQVAELAVPRLADWCAIDLLEPDGQINRVAIAHPDPKMLALAQEMYEAYPPDAERIRAATPSLIPEITDEILAAAAQDEDHLAVLRDLGLRSAIAVPLMARGRTLGQLVLILTRPEQRYGEQDLNLATEMARLAGLAVDNARLYQESIALNDRLEERVTLRTAQIVELLEEQRRDRQRFQDLLESTPDAMIIADGEGRIVLANRQTESLFGYPREALLGQRVDMLLPLDLRGGPENAWLAYRDEPGARPMEPAVELHGRRRDGSEFDIEVSLSPSGGQGEEDRLTIATIRDVTERKRTERALHESQALYETIADNLPEASIAVVDSELRYRLARGPLLDLLGYSPEMLEGELVQDAADPANVERRLQAYRAALAGEATTQEVTVRGREVQIQTTPLRDDAGDIFAALAVSLDITERKAAEESTRALLRVSEKLNSTLDLEEVVDTMVLEAIGLTNAGGGFAGLSEDGVLRSTFFRADDRTLAFEEEWPAGRGIPGWVSEHKQPYLNNNAAEDPLAIPGFPEQFEMQSVLTTPILSKSDELLGMFAVVNKRNSEGFSQRDQRILMGLSHIAAIALENARVYEEHRELSRRVMAAQDEERRRLSRDLHDSAGQLLTVLSLQLSQLAAARDFEPEDVRQQLREAVAFTQQAHGEIRAVSRNLRPPALDLIGLNDAFEELCRDFGARTSMQVTYEGADVSGLPDLIRLSFYRFLQETLTNAARHAQADHVHVALRRLHDELILEVSDDGVGFAPAPNPISGRSADGVGLTSLRERFAMLNGSVTIQSRPGEGTRVIGRCRIPPK